MNSPTFVRSVYNKIIRPHLHERIAVYNGVAVRNIKLFDRTDVFPAFESALVDGLRNYVSLGDDCVIVGGGRGVTTVVAAGQVGRGGTVTTYEAAKESVYLTAETIEINRMEGIASAEHAIVGEPGRLRGTAGTVKIINVTDLPVCDVLVLDCNGAESNILSNLENRPTILFIRVNGLEGVDEAAIADTMTEKGYEIVDRTVEVEETGVVLLTGRRDAEESNS